MTDSEPLTEARVREANTIIDKLAADVGNPQAWIDARRALSALGTARAVGVITWDDVKAATGLSRVLVPEDLSQFDLLAAINGILASRASPAPATAAEIRAGALEEAAKVADYSAARWKDAPVGVVQKTTIDAHVSEAETLAKRIRALSEGSAK